MTNRRVNAISGAGVLIGLVLLLVGRTRIALIVLVPFLIWCWVWNLRATKRMFHDSRSG